MHSSINSAIEDLLARWDHVLTITDEAVDRWFPELTRDLEFQVSVRSANAGVSGWIDPHMSLMLAG